MKKGNLSLTISTLFLASCGGGGGGGNNPTPTADINTGNFDGIWFGPCVNNAFGTSARQMLSLNGTSLVNNWGQSKIKHAIL